MREVNLAVNNLIDTIRKSSEFSDYEKAKNVLKEDPELKEKVDEYRKKNFELQNMDDDGHLAERLERFAAENAYLSEQPVVREFLDAEVGLCRLLQDITEKVVDSIDFE